MIMWMEIIMRMGIIMRMEINMKMEIIILMKIIMRMEIYIFTMIVQLELKQWEWDKINCWQEEEALG